MITIVLLVTITILITILQCTIAKSPIHIGFISNIFNPNGTHNSQGQQELAAFLMALEDIRSQGILQNYEFKFCTDQAFGKLDGSIAVAQMLGYTSRLYKVNGSFPNDIGTRPINAAIITSENYKAIQMYNIFEEQSIPVVITHAMAAEMSKGSDFPAKIRVVPSESYDGLLMQKLLYNDFGFRKIGIFYTDDVASTGSVLNFLKLRQGQFDVLTKHQINVDQKDHSKVIKMAKAANPNVFVFFMDVDSCSQILIQGYHLGLFKSNDDQIIFVSNTCTGEDMIKHINVKYSTYVSQIPQLMKGIIGIKNDPLFSVHYTPEGQAFMTSLRQRQHITSCSTQINTLWNGSTGSIRAENVVDDNSPHHEHLFRRNSTSNSCRNVDFGSLKQDTSDLWAYAPYVYDATMVLAKAYHKVLEVDNVPLNSVTSSILTDAACSIPLFKGVTGEIHFFCGIDAYIEDDDSSVLYGKGDREVGFDFHLENFNSIAQAFVKVGHMDHKSTFQLCDEHLKDQRQGIFIPCDYYVQYNTFDGRRPRDSNPDIYNEASTGVVTFLIIIGVLGIVSILFIAVTLLLHRQSKLVKASQPPMMAFILVGQLFSYGRVIIGGRYPTLIVCMEQFWFGHMAFIFAFGAMTVKTWRVYKIISNNSLKRVKISNWDVIKLTLALVALGVIYIIIAQTVGKPRVSEKIITAANQSTYFTTCSFEHTEVETTIYVLEAIFLIYGWRICSASKNAPSAINESGPISSAISVIAIISVIVLPLISFIQLPTSIICIISSMGFWAASTISTALVFGPKMMLLLQGQDIDWGEQGKKEANMKFGVRSVDSKVESEVSAPLVNFVTEYLHGKSVDEKYFICQKQIEWLRNMLITLEEKRTSENSKTKSSNSYVIPDNEVTVHVKPDIEKTVWQTDTTTEYKINTVGSIDP